MTGEGAVNCELNDGPGRVSGPFLLWAEMLTEFEKKVASYVRERGLFDAAKKALFAFSGGADSTALLYVLNALKKGGELEVEMICGHINHGLRGAESDGDEAFVIEEAGKVGVPIVVNGVDVRGEAKRRKLSIETAARQLRMEQLLDVAKRERADTIVTAHQKDDNAETVVQRIARGTGFRGLGGIWPVREFRGVRFVRPLLCVSRDEVVEYLRSRGVLWREDRTNAEVSYRRNYIRHRLLPALQDECAGSLVDEISELSERARRFYSGVCASAGKVWGHLADENGDELKIDCGLLLRESLAVQVEIIRRALERVGSGERDLRQEHYERILELAQSKRGSKRVELPGGFIVRSEYGSLVFGCAGSRAAGLPAKPMEITVSGQTRLGDCVVEAKVSDIGPGNLEKFRQSKDSNVEWFDLEKLRLPLYIRGRKVGDRFVPLGQRAEKRVGKFLTASRVSKEVREKALVVADTEKVVWLWPVRMSEEVKVTGRTKKVVQVRITEQ